ncbi:MAG: helix-turn-helix domain-containing protein [Chloroflexi bacterium]|nr:helix-turn-helix domain-containing protein [Chloroflexota bacterium]
MPKTTAGHERRRRMVRFIRAYEAEHGRSPKLAEIAAAAGTAPSNAHYHLTVLRALGYVRLREAANRLWTVVVDSDDVPPLDSIAAAAPTPAQAAPAAGLPRRRPVVPLPPGSWMPRRRKHAGQRKRDRPLTKTPKLP